MQVRGGSPEWAPPKDVCQGPSGVVALSWHLWLFSPSLPFASFTLDQGISVHDLFDHKIPLETLNL